LLQKRSHVQDDNSPKAKLKSSKVKLTHRSLISFRY